MFVRDIECKGVDRIRLAWVRCSGRLIEDGNEFPCLIKLGNNCELSTQTRSMELVSIFSCLHVSSYTEIVRIVVHYTDSAYLGK
jgi:hypothetical protein